LPLATSAALDDIGAAGAVRVEEQTSYVSLLPGSMPDGLAAIITNRRTGERAETVLLDGGFDPQAIRAQVGDSVDVTVTRASGVVARASVSIVAKRPPRIVRTVPPKGATDVPISLRMFVVFSEPVAAGSVTPASMFVTTGGSTVAGALGTVPGSGYVVEFTPNGLLAPSTHYSLTVETVVTDRSGDPLQEAAHVEFTTAAATGTPVIGSLSIASAGYSTCALDERGHAYCWGANPFGMLAVDPPQPSTRCTDPDGDGIVDCALTPAPVRGQLALQSITMGNGHACGITRFGDAYCWGTNAAWQLGNADSHVPEVPVQVIGGLRFGVLAAGTEATCGLALTGDAYCWGSMAPGTFGPAGNRTPFIPTLVPGGLRWTHLTLGGSHACAIADGGLAYCWGLNIVGQLGVGDAPLERCGFVACASRPQQVAGDLRFKAIAAGSEHTCAIATDDQTYCWGAWRDGSGNDPSFVPVLVPGGHAFVALAAGYEGASCGIAAAGDLWCWGRPTVGPWSPIPVRVAPGIAFASVTISISDMCGRATDATLYCWGGNWNGELGIGTTNPSEVPVRVRFP
jgi:alpha-tubulin suppressor-like RCC1 family protein